MADNLKGMIKRLATIKRIPKLTAGISCGKAKPAESSSGSPSGGSLACCPSTPPGVSPAHPQGPTIYVPEPLDIGRKVESATGRCDHQPLTARMCPREGWSLIFPLTGRLQLCQSSRSARNATPCGDGCSPCPSRSAAAPPADIGWCLQAWRGLLGAATRFLSMLSDRLMYARPNSTSRPADPACGPVQPGDGLARSSGGRLANFKKRRGGVPLSFNSIRAASTVNVVPGTGFPALVGLLFPVPACIFDEAAEGSPSLAAAHEVEPGAATGLPHSCAALAGHSRQISHNALGISPVPAGVRLGSTQARDSRGERAACCRSAALCGLLTVLALAALHTGIVAGRHGTVGRQTVTPRATAARDGAEFLMENNPVTPQRMWGGPMEVSPIAIQTAQAAESIPAAAERRSLE